MNRRAFAAFAAFGVALPLVAGVAQADQADKRGGPPGKPAPAPPSSALSVDELVTRVEAFYDQATTFKARFRQSFPGYDPRGLAGSVSFERPDKMSWRYTQSGNRAVSDGRRIRVYEKENKQLFDHALSASLFPAVLSFLSAEGKLGQRFKFTKRDSPRSKFEDSLVLIGEPLQPWPVCERLLFYVNARSYEVQSVRIISAGGGRSRFDFSNSRLNARVPQAEFEFNPPPGTRIIRL